jgi:hypothetical protein
MIAPIIKVTILGIDKSFYFKQLQQNNQIGHKAHFQHKE